MAFRSDIMAGRAVIQVSIQDTLDRQLRTMKSKLFAFSNSINKIGQDLLVAGSIGTFGAIFPVKQFVDFQDTMLFVQAKLKDTGVDIIKLEAQIRNLGRTTSFTSKEVAESAAVLAQAGVGRGIEDLLLPSLDLARGARIEIDAAARILTNAITAFGLGFDEAGTIASQMTTAVRLGTTDIVLLGESLKEVSGTLRNLGVPFQDSIALITALSNVSLRGTKAGTSLNTALTQLTSKFEELNSLGIKIDPTVDFANPRELFSKISDGLAQLTPTEQVVELQSIFNIRGARAVAGINVQGLEKLDDLVKQIKASTDEAREAAVLMDSRLGGAFRRAASAFDELNISIGATTEGPLTKLSVIFKDLFTSLSALATLYPVTTQWLVALPVISLAAGVGLIGLSVAASRLAIFITPLVALNSLLFDSIKKLGSLAFTPIAEGFRVIYQQPVARLSAAIARENNAVIKEQTRLQRELNRKKINPGNLTQAITAVNKAEAGRSLLTRPFDQIIAQLATSTAKINAAFDKFFKSIQKTYLKGFVSLGRSSRIAARQFQSDVVSGLSGGPGVSSGGSIIPGVRLVPPPVNDILTPIRGRGFAKQLEFGFTNAFEQLNIDFDKKQISTPLRIALQDAVTTAVNSVNNPGQVKSFPILAERIAQSIDDVLIAQKIPAQLQGTLTSLVKEALDKPIEAPTPKVVLGKQLKNTLQLDFFDQLDTPVQLSLFDNLVDDAKEATKSVKATEKTLVDLEKVSGRRSVRKPLTLKDLIARNLVTGLASTGSKIGSVFSNIGSATRRIFTGQNTFKALNTVVEGILRASRGVVSVVRGLFVGLRGIARFVFSLSGILTILELLILVGPKIAPIKSILDGIGAAFSTAFSTIAETIRATLPQIRKLFDALKTLAFVDPVQGIKDVKEAVGSIGQTLSSGFALAWERFKVEAEKGINFVKAAFAGLVATFSSVGSIIGSAAQTLFGSRSSNRDEPFEFGDGPIEALRGFFDGLLAFFEGLGTGIINAMDVVRTALTALFDVALRIYNLLAGYLGEDRDVRQADELSGGRFGIERAIEQSKLELQILKNRRSGGGAPNAAGGGGVNTALDEEIARIESAIRQREAALVKLGGNFTNPLTEILEKFSQDMIKIRENMNKAFNGIQTNVEQAEIDFYSPQLEDILPPVNTSGSVPGLLDGMLDGMLADLNNNINTGILNPLKKEANKDIANKLSPTDDILKTISGFGGDTRGQKLQIVPNRIEQQTKDAVEGVKDGVDRLNDQVAKLTTNAQPFVFQA